jgi:hypothetical protein
MASIMAPSIMAGLPHDIIRQIILESTREERLRKDALDYWTGITSGCDDILGNRPVDSPRAGAALALYYVHNQMKQVTRLERDACHMSALPLPGSPQADEGTGIMWRRVWWSRKSVSAAGAAAFFNVPWDEWNSLLKDRRQKEAATHYDQTGEFLLAQHD